MHFKKSQITLECKGCKPNRICVDEGIEFYYRSMKSSLKEDDIEMYSTLNEGKYVVSEKIIKTLKNIIYNYSMTAISKNVHIDKLGNIVNEYNNTHQRTIKIKTSTYIDFQVESTDKDPIVEVDHYVRISKYKVFLPKVTLEIGRKFGT